MKSLLSILFIAGSLVLSFPLFPVHAQTQPADQPADQTSGSSATSVNSTNGSIKSNTVCTKVGDPTDPEPAQCTTSTGGGGSGALGDILSWAAEITGRLQRGTWGFLNRILEAVTNGSYSTSVCPPDCASGVYWCTYLIIDTYNLAGHSGLTKGAHAAVVNMRRWWYTVGVGQGYAYVDYPANNQLLTDVKPGYALFMESVAGTHTGSEHVNMVKSITVDQRGDGEITTFDSNSSSITHTFPVAGWQIRNTPYPVRGFGGI